MVRVDTDCYGAFFYFNGWTEGKLDIKTEWVLLILKGAEFNDGEFN